jgi:hypothetical protein
MSFFEEVCGWVDGGGVKTACRACLDMCLVVCRVPLEGGHLWPALLLVLGDRGFEGGLF